MIDFIYTPREHHSVASPEELLRRHSEFFARKRRRGQRFVVHDDATPLVARVDSNSWLADCPGCGAGVAIDPEWPVACCFGCGAVYRALVAPPREDRDEIEAALLARPRWQVRTWLPGETSADLHRENTAHGLPQRKEKKP